MDYSKSNGETCLNCRYSAKRLTVMTCGMVEATVCRAHPPTVTATSGNPSWPRVNREDWCGEWKG